MVEATLQTERSAPQRLGRDVRDQRVARRRAETLPQTVDHPQPDHLPGGGRHGDHGAHDDRDEVPDHDQRPAARRSIRQLARNELHQRRRRIGGAVERAQRDGTTPQHPGDERGEQGVNHLACEVV